MTCNARNSSDLSFTRNLCYRYMFEPNKKTQFAMLIPDLLKEWYELFWDYNKWDGIWDFSNGAKRDENKMLAVLLIFKGTADRRLRSAMTPDVANVFMIGTSPNIGNFNIFNNVHIMFTCRAVKNTLSPLIFYAI
uniref:Uncharacterized protein n=1 Tax=Rhizophagus irregularis (strain DAOM 181602 / DAOM 197198 / MUCL 43194) TaxID=747089 RepID=U9TTA8_RHIID